MLTVGMIEKKIKRNMSKSYVLQDTYSHKDIVSDPYDREVERLKEIKVFVEAGVDFELDESGGTALVEGKFVYALRSHKWRVKGGSVWYRSRGASDFIKRFVKQEKV